jgi:hypothetical protein
MVGAMTKNRILSDILEWNVPEEVLAHQLSLNDERIVK